MTVNTVNLENHQPQTPLGLLLAPLVVSQGQHSSAQESHFTILIGWTRPYNKLGIVQKSGQIRIGDRLVEINGISVRNWTFEKIIRVLRCFDDGVRIRSLGFEVLKEEGGIENRTFAWSVARRRLYSLNTSIQSVTVVDEEKEKKEEQEQEQEEEEVIQEMDSQHQDEHVKEQEQMDNNENKRRIAKYEIQCELVIRHYHGHDQIIQYSVWKRFSEFKTLHQSLMDKYSYQSSKNRRSLTRGGERERKGKERRRRKNTASDILVAFPSNRVLQSILYGTSSEWFLNERKRELQTYWSGLESHHSEFFDFGDPDSHRYCKEMALFLDIEPYLHPRKKKNLEEGQLHKQRQRHHPQRPLGEEDASSSPLVLHFELGLDTSAISDIPIHDKSQVGMEEEKNKHPHDVNDTTHGSLLDHGVVYPAKQASSSFSTRSSAILSSDEKKTKKKKKSKNASAKAAFQRILLEDDLSFRSL